MQERERRFKVKNMPPIDSVSGSVMIEQTYTNSEDKTIPMNRIRKTVGEEFTNYTHCTKYNFANTNREEIEPTITENQYLRILDFVGKDPLKKKRVYVNLPNNKTAEVDFFDDGDVIVEVEFNSQKEMDEFISPSWFGEEILNSQSYSYKKFCELNKSGYWK